MSDLTDATLAVLAEMDWPDDREFSAHVEPDGYALTPPGAYWDMARDVAAAVAKALGHAVDGPESHGEATEARPEGPGKHTPHSDAREEN